MARPKRELTVIKQDGEPCEHPGCINHRTHPCENCGRIRAIMAGRAKHLQRGHYGDCAVYRALEQYKRLNRINKLVIEAKNGTS